MLCAAPTEVSLLLADEAATARLGEDIATILRPGDVVRLSGDLGAGKTSLARALVRALAGESDYEVPSPTFPLRIDYAFPRLRLVHLDLYRVAETEELDELALDDALAESALIVEWPERLPRRTGLAELDVALSIAGTGRHAAISADADIGARLRRSLLVRRFLDDSGRQGAMRRPIVGDASVRAYERIATGAGTEILMNAPARPEGPPLHEGRSYDDIAHRALDIRPFVAIGTLLESRGVRVPAIRASDLEEGLLLLEDFGSKPIVDETGEPRLDRYEAAIDRLADMHAKAWPERVESPAGSYVIPSYDHDALLVELSLFPDWVGNGSFPAEDRAAFLAAWARILADAGLRTDTLVLRDFHSPNILWQAEAGGLDRVGVLDYQDALLGDPAYDVASLAQDARVAISPEDEERLVARYVADRAAADPAFDETRFRRAYRVLAAQRATKVMGAFHRLAIADGKTGYRRHLDHVKALLRRNLSDPVLSGLSVWYEPYLA